MAREGHHGITALILLHGATGAAGPRTFNRWPMSLALLAVVMLVFAFELWWLANC